MVDEATRADEARLELACEAVEGFVLAVSHGGPACNEAKDARATLKDALRALTVPALRVIQGGFQPQEAIGEDRVVCRSCDRHHPCHLGRLCPDWAASIRKAIDEAPESLPSDSLDAKGHCTMCSDDPVVPGEECPYKKCPHETEPAPSPGRRA